MTPRRIGLKLFLSPDPGAALDLHPFIGIFHGFIRDARVEGLLIDVADYAHVPNGPGVMLIGHEVDYGMDLGEGRAGLLIVRKHYGDMALAEVLEDTLRKTLVAAQALEAEGSVGLSFELDSFELRLIDRLAAPNTEETFRSIRDEIGAVLDRVFAPGKTTLDPLADDPRKPLTLRARIEGCDLDLSERIERLGGAVLSEKGDFGISVWDLKKLRDDGADFVLIDVREPHEYESANLGGRLIPLGSLPERLEELDKSARIIVHCEVGMRGGRAVETLRDAGFADAWNLRGGLNAWVERIDPSLRES